LKYKIVSRKKKSIQKGLVPYTRADSPEKAKRKESALSENGELYGFGIFTEPESAHEEKKKKRRSRLRPLLLYMSLKGKRILARAAARCRARREAKKNRPSDLPFLAGALAAALTVALFSGGFVLYRLFFKNAFLPYTEITVPQLMGSSYSESDPPPEGCVLQVEYVFSDTEPRGRIISQSPLGGVHRRVYGNEDCKIELKVSLGEETAVIEELCGLSLGDAALRLKNSALRFDVVRVYSDTAEKNKVISTSPAAGETIKLSDTVTLTVSLGPEITYIPVPNLVGLSESDAEEALIRVGLRVGRIDYVRSEKAAGSVIAQSEAPYFSLKKGEAVSFTVSKGMIGGERLVPDLFGLSLGEAKEALGSVGLVVGSVYAVSNGAPSGTVVAQSIAPRTPVGGGLTSVDIYVSS